MPQFKLVMGWYTEKTELTAQYFEMPTSVIGITVSVGSVFILSNSALQTIKHHTIISVNNAKCKTFQEIENAFPSRSSLLIVRRKRQLHLVASQGRIQEFA